MEQTTEQRVHSWISDSYDEKTRDEVKRIASEDPELLEECFYKSLEFGTGGLRGIMGVGPNRMNEYTVSMATQGLCDYLIEKFPGQNLRTAIAYDSRDRSKEFAQVTADVFASNGIEVYLYSELRPTPLLSFTVRELACQAGIVITASHNPKEYNGYKVYWNDGGQLVPPHDKGVIEKARAIKDPSQVKKNISLGSIQPVPNSVESKYYQKLQGLLKVPIDDGVKKNLKIVFTSLHGTGITMIPQALTNAGYSSVYIVKEQEVPDGNFPTVDSPNPEEKSAMTLGLQYAEEVGADILLGTDPDTDRVGMGIRTSSGKMELLNGNQAASILVHFLLRNSTEEEKRNGFIAKTIVTTELLKDIAENNGVKYYDTLTGFKYIAELIGERREWKNS